MCLEKHKYVINNFKIKKHYQWAQERAGMEGREFSTGQV